MFGDVPPFDHQMALENWKIANIYSFSRRFYANENNRSGETNNMQVLWPC